MSETWLSLKKASEYCNLGERTLRQAIKAGSLAACPRSRQTKIFIERVVLDEWMRTGRGFKQ